jgi:hypothetical protein
MVTAALSRSTSELISPGVELEQPAATGSKPQIAKTTTSFLTGNLEGFCMEEL